MAKNELYYILFFFEKRLEIDLVEIKEGHHEILLKEEIHFESLDFLKNQLEKFFEKGATTENAVIFVSHAYLDTSTNTLKKEFKQELLSIFKNLKLNLLGYLETYEALAKFLSEKDSFPLNAVLVEIEESSLSLSLSKGGKISSTISLPLGSNLLESLKESLYKLDNQPLPAKLIVSVFKKDLDHKQLETARWPKELFLHHPEIKIISNEKLHQSLIKVFVQEISEEEKTEKPKQEKESSLPLGFKEDEKLLEEEKTAILPVKFSLGKLSFPSFPKFKLPKIKFVPFKKTFVLAALLFLLLPALAFFHEKYLHKASIKIYPQSTEVEIVDNLIFSSQKPYFYIAKKNVDLARSFQATGKKAVGKKASGVLKFYNFSGKALTITPKTKIVYKDKAYFVKEDIQVPPAKEATISGSLVKQPGTTEARVEAEDIGEQYNLSTDQKLQIDGLDLDLYFAKIKDKITGGASETVKTVTSKDVATAREELKKEAIEKIDIDTLIPEPESYYPLKELAQAKIIKEEINKEIGEISDEFNIKATLEVSFPFIDKTKLIENFKNQILEQAGPEASYDPKNFEFEVDSIKNNEEETLISFTLKGKTIKKINLEEAKTRLKGLSLSKIPTFTLDNVERVEVVKNTAFLPFFSSHLPFFTQNLDLQLVY